MQTFKLLSNDSVLLSQPKLIEKFGRPGAQLLSQLHYWLTKKETLGCNNNGVHWIYNSADAWAEQLRISPRQVQRIVKKLTDFGVLLVEKLSVNKYNRTNHYTIDYDSLKIILEDHVAKEHVCEPITTKCRNASGQNVVITIQKLPNKDFNKSDEFSKNLEVVGQGTNQV
jgi:predicted transcriptional regulator